MRFRANNHGFIFKEIMKHRTIKEPTTNFPAFLADKGLVLVVVVVVVVVAVVAVAAVVIGYIVKTYYIIL